MPEYKVCKYHETPRELFNFRYKIYVEELKRHQTYVQHELETIEDPLDPTGYQGIATENGKIIGCVRLNLAREGGVAFYRKFYQIDRLPHSEQMTASICTRYMVTPEYRRTRVPLELLKLIYLFGIENGSTACYMDTNEPYIPMYLKFGYEALFEKEHPDYGLVTVMRLPVLDLEHLRATRSPFAPICERFLAEKSESALV
jgi:GNAT superfamily N-acetyltransferase